MKFPLRKINLHFTLLLTISFLAQYSLAQKQSSGEIYKEIQRLNQFGSVLYIAAHPDDENTRLISYLSKGKQYRVGYLSLTRGDGGQNLIGSEQGTELGLIRTNELLQARSVDGAEQFFTRAYDFGFSKNPEEAFAFWNKDSVLRDVVWVIRNFKPDVIITRFPDTGEGGHGHHTASAILAKEAFKAAADETQFPEQLTEVSVWQAKKLFWNTFNFGTNNTTSDEQFKLDVGAYDQILGKSYGEIASESRSKHSSQGFGVPLVRTPIQEYFVTWEGNKPKSSFMEGVDTGWSKCMSNANKAKAITQKVNTILTKFDFKAPSKSIPLLYELKKELEQNYELTSPTLFWLNQKIEAVNNIITQCAGVYCEILSENQNLVPGEEVEVKFSVVSRMPESNKFNLEFNFLGNDFVDEIPSGGNEMTFAEKVFTVTVPNDIDYTSSQPYWLREPHSKGLFADVDLNLLGKAKNPEIFKAEVLMTFSNPSFTITLNPSLRFKYNDPSKGEVYQPVFIVPPAVVIPETDRTFFQLSENDNSVEKTISLKVKNYKDNFHGILYVEIPEEWQMLNTQEDLALDFENAGSEKNIELRLRLFDSPKEILSQKNYSPKIKFFIMNNGFQYDVSEKRINYSHIPNQIIFSKAETELVLSPISREIANKIGRVGYISGAGDKVMESLKEVGIDITEIDEDELNSPAALGRYKTIIVGIRAFNVKEELKSLLPNLMNYIENGGRLLVQYNTNNRIAPLDFNIAPYPMTITNKRVTDETAKISMLVPNHKLMQEPFNISDLDFDNWIQERGIYFAGERDSKFTSLFSIADPNEEANDGSLVYAEYGNGSFIYTGLVFFRQLPAGNLGAYRLIANLIYNP